MIQQVSDAELDLMKIVWANGGTVLYAHIMEELAKYRASTMLVVTHELSFALKVADRILLMNKGKIVESGKPIEIFANPQSTIGKTYKDLIDYQMNTI